MGFRVCPAWGAQQALPLSHQPEEGLSGKESHYLEMAVPGPALVYPSQIHPVAEGAGGKEERDPPPFDLIWGQGSRHEADTQVGTGSRAPPLLLQLAGLAGLCRASPSLES